jgi:hypothetical protein
MDQPLNNFFLVVNFLPLLHQFFMMAYPVTFDSQSSLAQREPSVAFKRGGKTKEGG